MLFKTSISVGRFGQQKPKAYGPPKFVRQVVRHNAEWMRIDPASIIGYWPFWEKGGDKGHDVAPNNLTATLYNNPTWNKKALDFNGTNQYGSAEYYKQVESTVLVGFVNPIGVTNEEYAGIFATGEDASLRSSYQIDFSGSDDIRVNGNFVPQTITSNITKGIVHQAGVSAGSGTIEGYWDGKRTLDFTDSEYDITNFNKIGFVTNRAGSGGTFSDGVYSEIDLYYVLCLSAKAKDIHIDFLYSHPYALLVRPWTTPPIFFDEGGGAAGTISSSLDAMIQKSIQKTTSFDAQISKQKSVDISVDAILSALKSVTADMDGVLSKELTKAASIDSLLSKSGVTTTTAIDAVIRKTLTESLSFDGLIQHEGQTKTVSIDALLNRIGVTASTSIDALVRKSGLTEVVSLDAILYEPSANLITTNLDALLKKEGVTFTCNMDALVSKSYTSQLSVDALIQKSKSTTADMDALVSKQDESTILLDALLAASGITQSVSLDAIIGLSGTISTVIDAILVRSMVVTIQMDALVSGTFTQMVMLDAVVGTPSPISTYIAINKTFDFSATKKTFDFSSN